MTRRVKKGGWAETEESSVPAIRPELVPLPKDTAPALPYNEFDFRHLRGCPQSVFRPGDRCSCNVALREYVMFHNSYRSANDSDITRRWMDKISEEITCDTTRIDLDFDPNVGELKK